MLLEDETSHRAGQDRGLCSRQLAAALARRDRPTLIRTMRQPYPETGRRASGRGRARAGFSGRRTRPRRRSGSGRRSSRSACVRVSPSLVDGRRFGPSRRVTRTPPDHQEPYQLSRPLRSAARRRTLCSAPKRRKALLTQDLRPYRGRASDRHQRPRTASPRCGWCRSSGAHAIRSLLPPARPPTPPGEASRQRACRPASADRRRR